MRIGQLFRYGRPYNAKEPVIDGSPNYFHAVLTPGQPLPLLESGINKIAKVKAPEGLRRPMILIASSPHKIGQEETPWQDVFSVDIGHIRYFGDNKTAGRDPSLAPGNRILLEQLGMHTSPSSAVRELSVPLVFFRRVAYGGRRKGQVQFQGMGIVTGAQRLTQFHPRRRSYFTNYVFDFCVLSLAAEAEEFDWGWLRARYDGMLTLRETLASAPESWKKWIQGGPKYEERYRRSVSKLVTVSPRNQRPEAETAVARDLHTILVFFESKKHRFENLASAVAASIIKQSRRDLQRGLAHTGRR